MQDRKISVKDLAENGLWVGEKEILPQIAEAAQAHSRSKGDIPYFKILGKIYYSTQELIAWANSKRRNNGAA